MHVWFFSPHEHPGSHTSRTYNFSQELLKRGHNVTLFVNSYSHRTHEDCLSNKESWRVENIGGIRVVWVKTIHYKGNRWMRGLNMLSFAWRAVHCARSLQDKPDVAVGDSVPPSAGWVASRIADKLKCAFVYQVRDVWPIALVYDGGLSKKNPAYYVFRIIEIYLYRKAHRICATMPFLQDHVRESGADPAKVVWVPNGVDLSQYPYSDAYDGGKDLPLIAMYVGAFGFAHDVITIVRAAHILQRKGNKYHFIIVGDGVKKKECIRESETLGLSNIEFRNSVPKSEVPELQKEADILIAAVLDSDAYQFGHNLNKLYDYFASGRPVILSGKIPNDDVADAGAGFSVAPENPVAMAEALEKYQGMSPLERMEMGRRARCHAEQKFDAKKLARLMENLLTEAVEIKRNSLA